MIVSKFDEQILLECSLHPIMRSCASFSAVITKVSQLPVKPSTSFHFPPGQYHGGRERELWNQIDLSLKSNFPLLLELLEQMTETS